MDPDRAVQLGHEREERVIEVWESQEAADAYFRGNLEQALQDVVGVSLGQPETFTVYNVIAR